MAYEHDPFARADADALAAALTRRGNRERSLRALGVCLHGWSKSPAYGPAQCLHCGKVFADSVALDRERAELMADYL